MLPAPIAVAERRILPFGDQRIQPGRQTRSQPDFLQPQDQVEVLPVEMRLDAVDVSPVIGLGLQLFQHPQFEKPVHDVAALLDSVDQVVGQDDPVELDGIAFFFRR